MVVPVKLNPTTQGFGGIPALRAIEQAFVDSSTLRVNFSLWAITDGRGERLLGFSGMRTYFDIAEGGGSFNSATAERIVADCLLAQSEIERGSETVLSEKLAKRVEERLDDLRDTRIPILGWLAGFHESGLSKDEVVHWLRGDVVIPCVKSAAIRALAGVVIRKDRPAPLWLDFFGKLEPGKSVATSVHTPHPSGIPAWLREEAANILLQIVEPSPVHEGRATDRVESWFVAHENTPAFRLRCDPAVTGFLRVEPTLHETGR